MVSELPSSGNRQFRHIVKHLLFPDAFERVASGKDKRKILAAFANRDPAQLRNWTDVELDKSLLEVRNRFKSEYGQKFDFYLDDISPPWKPVTVEPDEEGELTNPKPGLDRKDHCPRTTRPSRRSESPRPSFVGSSAFGIGSRHLCEYDQSCSL
jgi:hypothetical protein